MDAQTFARDYIASVRWQFAKTMPQWPHEYTVRIDGTIAQTQVINRARVEVPS